MAAVSVNSMYLVGSIVPVKVLLPLVAPSGQSLPRKPLVPAVEVNPLFVSALAVTPVKAGPL